MQTTDVFLKSETRQQRWVPRILISIGVLFCVFVVGHIRPVVDAIGIGVGAIAFLLFGTCREIGLTPAGNVLVLTRTWDVITLRRREIATTDIEGVLIRTRYLGSDSACYVGLLLKSRKFIQLRGFSSNNLGAAYESGAQRFAQEVLEFTHLPFCGRQKL